MSLARFLQVYTAYTSNAGGVDIALRLLSGFSTLGQTQLDPKADPLHGQLVRFNQSIGESRAMMRLFGAPKQLSAFLNNSDADPMLRFLHLAQNLSIGLFYIPDGICTLGSKGIAFQGWDLPHYGRLASALWAAWIIIGLAENIYKLQNLTHKQGNLQGDIESASKEEKRPLQDAARHAKAERVDLYYSTAGHLADLVLALTGSFKWETPPFSQRVGGILTLIACFVSIRAAVKSIVKAGKEARAAAARSARG